MQDDKGYDCDDGFVPLPIAGVPEYNGENFRTEMFKPGGWLAMEGNRNVMESMNGMTNPKSAGPSAGNGGGIGTLAQFTGPGKSEI